MQNFKELLSDKTEYTKQDLVSLLKMEGESSLKELFKFADKLRCENIGKKISLSNLIQFSNYCSKNCLYCGLRKSNFKIQRNRLNFQEIVQFAKLSEKNSFKSITLEAGDDSYFDIELLVKIIKLIKQQTSLILNLSIGERTEAEYIMLKNAGCDRFTLKHKTSDPILYRQLHPDLKYSTRIKSLKLLKTIGFEVQSGIVVGLPGQTFESIANDILLFSELNIDIIQINPYIPHKDTPLARKFDQIGGYFAPAVGYFEIDKLIYKIIAITRLVNKKSNILISQVPDQNINNITLFTNSLQVGADSILISMIDAEFLKCLNSSAKSIFSKDDKFLLKQLKNVSKSFGRCLD